MITRNLAYAPVTEKLPRRAAHLPCIPNVLNSSTNPIPLLAQGLDLQLPGWWRGRRSSRLVARVGKQACEGATSNTTYDRRLIKTGPSP